MLETIIVTLIVLITLYFVIRHFMGRRKEGFGACRFCSNSDSCTRYLAENGKKKIKEL
jgi:hypothetical protein